MSATTWQLLVGALHVALASIVSAHVVLTKSDVRAAIGWTGLVWLTPILGSFLYFFLGINRIRRAAGRMRSVRHLHTADRLAARAGNEVARVDLPAPLARLATLTGRISGEPLTEGNTVEPLVDGDAGYPAMLEAIGSARTSIALATYIFDRGRVASRVVEALAAAVPVGLLATSVLVVNNLRDVETDRVAGKRTLAVRLGARAARGEYAALVLAPYALLPCYAVAFGESLAVLLPVVTLPLAWPLVRGVLGGAVGAALNPVLGATARLGLAFSLAFALGYAL